MFNKIRYCRLAGIQTIGTLRRVLKTRIFEKVNKMFFYKQHAKNDLTVSWIVRSGEE